MLRRFSILLATLIVVAACSAGGDAGVSQSAAPSPAAEDPSDAPGASTVALPASILDPIIADAAARLGVDPSAVKIVTARAETFSDGSLGCPKPGEMYTQALVDGYQVIVEIDVTQLDYRGSRPNQFKICERP